MRYVFGDYTLDTRRQELLQAGHPIALRPKVFLLLAYLVQHRDRIVSKTELLEQLWPELFLGDATLNTCLKEVRQAVGDTGRTQQVIHTRRSRGYRFVATVQVQPEPEAAAALQSPAVQDPARRNPAPPAPATPALTEVYKHVTVFSCALVYALSCVVAPEAEGMHALMQALFTYAQEVIQRYDGTIVYWDGEGFTALFGALVAYEDHAWRALLAACDLREQVQQPITLVGQPVLQTLFLTMGLHTGPVLVGRFAQVPQPLYTAAGSTTHLAARLQHLAQPGEILISEATYRHVHDAVHVRARGTLEATAGAPSCSVYMVQDMARQHAAGPGRGGRLRSHFVGRERELAMLHERLAQAMRGQGHVVSVVGEPGIGKSRLFDEFHRQLHDYAVTCGVGRCLSYGSAMPYMPVISLLRDLCGIHHTDPVAVVTTRLQRCLQDVGMWSDEFAPYLQQLLGLSAGTEPLMSLDPEAIKRRTFAALRQFCLALSQQRPLVLTLEDTHWIDHTSEDFFSLLVQSLAGASVLLLVAYRPGYRLPWLDKSYATQLALQPLPAQACQRLVESLVPDQAILAAVLHTILTRAEGNPFFVEELAQTMLTHGDMPAGLEVPETIQGVLMARLDRLPEPARRLAQMASILGRTVPVKLVRVLWDGPGEIEDALDMLERHEFLYTQVGSAELLYVFKHALTQEVAYSSLPLTHRQVCHTTIAQAVETRYAHCPDEALELLAYHYGCSTDAAKAIAYLRQFGAKAARSFAHVEAIAAYQQALRHVGGLPQPQQDSMRLTLLLDQAFSLSGLGRFHDIHALLIPQQERLEQLRDPALLSAYYFRLGMTATFLGTYDQSLQYAQRALDAAQQCDDALTLGMSYYLLALTHNWSGQFRQGLAASRQAVTHLSNTRESHWLGMAYWGMGESAAFLGEFKIAVDALAHTAVLGASIDDLRLQHHANIYRGWVHIMQGEFALGMPLYQRILAHEPDAITGMAARLYLGIAYLEQDNTTQAIPLLEQVNQRARAIRFRFAESRTMTLLGEAFLAEQRLAAAQHLAQQALELGQSIACAYLVALAQRLLGRLAQTRGEVGTAAQYIHQALHTFTTLQTRYEVARTHLLLAELAHAQGDRDIQTTHLTAAHRLFQLLHIPHYVARTEHLLQTWTSQ